MKNIKFSIHLKPEAIQKLHDTLKEQGFELIGVTQDGDTLIIHLDDKEEKDPSEIVKAFEKYRKR